MMMRHAAHAVIFGARYFQPSCSKCVGGPVTNKMLPNLADDRFFWVVDTPRHATIFPMMAVRQMELEWQTSWQLSSWYM